MDIKNDNTYLATTNWNQINLYRIDHETVRDTIQV